MPPKKKAPSKKSAPSKGPKHLNSHTVVVDIPKYFILGSLIALLIAVIWIISPFLPSIIIGAVIAAGFHPAHLKILKAVRNHRTAAAIVSTVIILTIIIIPVSWFVSYITQEAIDTYIYVEAKVEQLLELDVKVIPEIIENSFAGKYLEDLDATIAIKTEDIVSFAASLIQNVSQFLVNQTTNFAKQLSVLAFHIFVLFLSIFFFFRDGDRAIKELHDLIPLANKYRDVIIRKLYLMSRGILYGVFGAAMAQGFLGGIGFSLAGIQNAAFWGTIMAFFAIVPYVGSTIIWIPAAFILFVTGHWVAGLFLVLWGIFVVGTVDNVIKPIVIGESARIHPLLSFLVILGGIFTMGLPGLIIAPYLLSLALTFLHVYKLEYQSVLNED